MQRVIIVLLLLTFLIGLVFSGKDLTKDSDGDGLYDNVDDLDDDNDGILDIHDEDDDGDGIKDLEVTHYNFLQRIKTIRFVYYLKKNHFIARFAGFLESPQP